MKGKMVTKSGVEIDDLEMAFVDLNKEYEEFKQASQTNWQAQHLKNHFDGEM